MVVKFTDAVKRAELAIKLKKKRDRLAARMKELEELVNKEKDLLSSGESILRLALFSYYKLKLVIAPTTGNCSTLLLKNAAPVHRAHSCVYLPYLPKVPGTLSENYDKL